MKLATPCITITSCDFLNFLLQYEKKNILRYDNYYSKIKAPSFWLFGVHHTVSKDTLWYNKTLYIILYLITAMKICTNINEMQAVKRQSPTYVHVHTFRHIKMVIKIIPLYIHVIYMEDWLTQSLITSVHGKSHCNLHIHFLGKYNIQVWKCSTENYMWDVQLWTVQHTLKYCNIYVCKTLLYRHLKCKKTPKNCIYFMLGLQPFQSHLLQTTLRSSGRLLQRQFCTVLYTLNKWCKW